MAIGRCHPTASAAAAVCSNIQQHPPTNHLQVCLLLGRVQCLGEAGVKPQRGSGHCAGSSSNSVRWLRQQQHTAGRGLAAGACSYPSQQQQQQQQQQLKLAHLGVCLPLCCTAAVAGANKGCCGSTQTATYSVLLRTSGSGLAAAGAAGSQSARARGTFHTRPFWV